MRMTAESCIELDRIWGHPDSFYGPESDDDAARLDGIYPLPGMTIRELRG